MYIIRPPTTPSTMVNDDVILEFAVGELDLCCRRPARPTAQDLRASALLSRNIPSPPHTPPSNSNSLRPGTCGVISARSEEIGRMVQNLQK